MKSFNIRTAGRIVMAAAIPLAISAATAGAQYGNGNRNTRADHIEVLEWQGRVDREIRLQIDNRQASVLEMGSNERARRRVNMVSGIPNRPGRLSVQVMEGRGKVDVVQQPNAGNGYTAVIRLRDPDGGAGRYRIAAYWDGTGRWNNGRRR